jgi:hypothetical protein
VWNHLAGADNDAATTVANACFEALRRFNQSAGIAALAGEVLEDLPTTHPSYGAVADEAAQAHLALGMTSRAMERYRSLQLTLERRVASEPDRADYQVDLAISLFKVGSADEGRAPAPWRALAILEGLQAEGRLAPEHEPKIQALRAMVGKA